MTLISAIHYWQLFTHTVLKYHCYQELSSLTPPNFMIRKTYSQPVSSSFLTVKNLYKTNLNSSFPNLKKNDIVTQLNSKKEKLVPLAGWALRHWGRQGGYKPTQPRWIFRLTLTLVACWQRALFWSELCWLWPVFSPVSITQESMPALCSPLHCTAKLGNTVFWTLIEFIWKIHRAVWV